MVAGEKLNGKCRMMERRVLGKTGESLSVVGCGGIVFCGESPESSSEIVARAIERGVTYFDIGPSYGAGEAEERLGPALAPYRKDVFLACKTGQRTKEGAAAELRTSLERLRTDHVNVHQLHGVKDLNEVEQVTAPGGALEAFLEARSEGRVRFIGFSAHSEAAALALLDRFPFDTMLFPFNYVCWHQGNFGHAALEKARELDVGILALKTLAKTARPEQGQRAWPKCWYEPVDSPEEAAAALRWTLARPVTACVSPSHAELLWWMCDAADDLAPMSDAEQKALAETSQGLVPIFPTSDE